MGFTQAAGRKSVAPPKRLGPSLAAHAWCYAVSGALLGWSLAGRWVRPVALTEPPGDDSAMMARVETRLDPNTADWADLAVGLPSVGESLARRIVAYRRERNPQIPGRPVFTSPEDLQAVRGIGPRTVEQMRPFLKFGS